MKKKKEWWYIFTTQRDLKSEDFTLHSFVEITPDNVQKINDVCKICKDEFLKNCFNMTDNELIKNSEVSNFFTEIKMLMMHSRLNELIICAIITEIEITRNLMTTWISTLNYDQIKNYQIC